MECAACWLNFLNQLEAALQWLSSTQYLPLALRGSSWSSFIPLFGFMPYHFLCIIIKSLSQLFWVQLRHSHYIYNKYKDPRNFSFSSSYPISFHCSLSLHDFFPTYKLVICNHLRKQNIAPVTVGAVYQCSRDRLNISLVGR